MPGATRLWLERHDFALRSGIGYLGRAEAAGCGASRFSVERDSAQSWSDRLAKADRSLPNDPGKVCLFVRKSLTERQKYVARTPRAGGSLSVSS
jgi:hypothetical protein